VSGRLDRKVYELPVGFKWFVDGLLDSSLGFAGEESAGASFSRIDGSVWTTDKDGIVPALLAAEMTARCGRDPGLLYDDLTRDLGRPAADRIEGAVTLAQKQRLAKLGPGDVPIRELAGERIERIIDRAPGNDAPFGGIKAITANAWFAARPSGTEPIYKLYAESFRGSEHLELVLREAQTVVDRALAGD
jgi:phosphoglucomutase